MSGAALRTWVLTLNGALAGKGIYASHIAIDAWITGPPDALDSAPLREPDDIARLYWGLHVDRGLCACRECHPCRWWALPASSWPTRCPAVKIGAEP
ncbi:hypothetical protein AB0H83_47905, partial [Dactylosporangium sp. NPDC050688]|uniref:hypothetical protein n=1 Tax=Dactylosporangium sp. NPDC050688 TaxID=3157217 RepID=UPI0033F7CEB1